MKILHIAPYSPAPPNFGGAIRIYHILKGLSRRHEVTFVTVGGRPEKELLDLHFGDSVRSINVVRPHSRSFMSRRWNIVLGALLNRRSFLFQTASATDMQSTLDRLCETEDFDVALMEFPSVGQFRLPKGVIRILDEHNVEFSNLERMHRTAVNPFRKAIFFRESRKLLREELDICREVDAILTTSVNDKTILDSALPSKDKFVIPNGVETEYFSPSDEEVEPFSMVFTGTMDYFPNQDAIIYFTEKIFPLIKKSEPAAKLYVVGKNPPASLMEKNSEDIVVTGTVSDVRPYARKAAVYVVPLRMGSGTRLKILEGLSMKKAIVTTSIGCEGLDVEDGINVDIADDPVAFAAKVITLFRDPERATRLGESGYRLVKDKYDWEAVAHHLDIAITSTIDKRDHIKRIDKQEGMNTNSRHHDREERPNGSQRGVKVLMYHRVVANQDGKNGYDWVITRTQLRQQLEFLDRWGYTCISFHDYSLSLKGEIALPSKPVILTFDDGYDEILANAVPVLKEFGAKATMFVLGDSGMRSNLWDADFVSKGVPLLTTNSIVQLHKMGFEIGSHSLTHPHLNDLPEDQAWDEVLGSKQILEDLIGNPVDVFAYPFGITSKRLKTLVRAAGYQYGCGVYSGPPRFGDDFFNVRRIPITRSTNLADFALKVLAPYEYYAWIRWKARQRSFLSFSN